MSGSLDHALIRQLLDELSTALEARGVRGHVYLIGGGAMITGYGRDRTTKGVDVRIDEAKDEVLGAAKAIGERHGLDEGERGRRYRAEWIRSGAAADRLDVSVADPSSADEEPGAHERVLQRATGDGVVRSIEQANEVINRYEQEAAAQDRPGTEGHKPVPSLPSRAGSA